MKLWKFASGLALVAVWLSSDRAMAQHQHGRDEGHGKQEAHGKAEQKEPKLPLCPVMGEPVDFNVKTMTDEGPVYFCCEGCIEKYQKDPEKYAKKTESQRAALKKMKRVQVTCPVTGNPIDGKTQIFARGKVVDFCCAKCVSKFDSADNSERERRAYDVKLEGCYTYQTRCPVSGDKIDPTAFADLPTGERIYLCCPGCGNKLLKDPAKYAPRLAAQGINIDVAKMSGKSGAGKHAENKRDHKGHDSP